MEQVEIEECCYVAPDIRRKKRSILKPIKDCLKGANRQPSKKQLIFTVNHQMRKQILASNAGLNDSSMGSSWYVL